MGKTQPKRTTLFGCNEMRLRSICAQKAEMTVARPKTDLTGVWSTGVHVGILVASFLLLYGQVFRDLASNWLDHDRLDCFLIPPISLYLVWLKRQQLAQLPIKPTRVWGLGIEVLAAALLVLGRISGVFVLEQFSLIAMILGLVLLLFGKAFLKTLSLPLAYLLLMMPVTEDLVAPLHWPLQLLTAQMAGTLLQGLGIATLVESQYITLPHIVLVVGKVCSGANYLVSIVAIGLPLAYLALRNRWSRIALVCVGIAIGVVANWARIALIGAWSYWGGQVLHGPFHIFQGLFVAWIGFLGLFAGAWALSKLEKVNVGRQTDQFGNSRSTVDYHG
ncbi:MAG: exosortase, partial [Nitrososphaera sp.]